jgi:hypothetical protein
MQCHPFRDPTARARRRALGTPATGFVVRMHSISQCFRPGLISLAPKGLPDPWAGNRKIYEKADSSRKRSGRKKRASGDFFERRKQDAFA